jgi:DNA polymerase-3 subunit gamma/tau
VTFILATTEPHKFPATIVSRCSTTCSAYDPGRTRGHLRGILDRRRGLRARGGVVDRPARGGQRARQHVASGQVLAWRRGPDEEDARGVLGLAGRTCFRADRGHGRTGLRRGAGHSARGAGKRAGHRVFLARAGRAWRTMFLLRQTGESGAALVEVTREEAGRWLEMSGGSICRTSTLLADDPGGAAPGDDQSGAGPALELLLLNLTYLPSLVPLDRMGARGRRNGRRGWRRTAHAGSCAARRGVRRARAAPVRPDEAKGREVFARHRGIFPDGAEASGPASSATAGRTGRPPAECGPSSRPGPNRRSIRDRRREEHACESAPMPDLEETGRGGPRIRLPHRRGPRPRGRPPGRGFWPVTNSPQGG